MNFVISSAGRSKIETVKFFTFAARFNSLNAKQIDTRTSMASPWGTLPLPPLLTSYPELLLAITCFLLLLIINKPTNLARGLPTSWPITGHTPYIFLHHDRLHDWSTDVLRRSGCTFIFKCPAGAPYDILLTCDPANVNHVFNTNFANYPKGDDFAEMFDFLGHGIFNSDKESWKFQRRKAHALMAAPTFRSFVVEASKAKVEKSLIPLLDHFVEHPKKTLDLQDVFMRFSFDITCILVFGIDPGCLSVGLPNVPFANAMDVAEEVVFYRHNMPKSWWKLMRWMGIGPEKRLSEAVKVLDRVVGEYVSKRREESSDGSGGDLLSSYLDSEAEIAESGFKEFDKFLRDTTMNLMVAGRDTISSALTWFFYLVAKNPNVEAKILKEIQAKGYADLGELVYLHAALCESLRLYPPVPFEHKGALKPDRFPSGVEVDENRKLLFSTYAMGRMEGVWGKDCLEFRPERWISVETGRVRHEPSYKFFAFNAGPRTCLGKDMAFTQLKAVAAAVIGRFQIRVAEGHVAQPKLSIILHMKGGLKVKVSRRED